MELDKIQKYILDLVDTNYTTNWKHLNYKLIPTTIINANYGNEESWNTLYQMLLNSNYKQIVRTKSGGICIDRVERYNNINKYDVKFKPGIVEITVATLELSARIQFRINNFKDKDNNEEFISGRQCFNIFKRELKKDNINIEDYKVDLETGKQLNSEIHKPDIRLLDNEASWQRTIEHAYHIDFHKFYMSGLYDAYPEFRPAIDRLAEKAKTDKKYKTVLAATIGYMHSEIIGYKYANLAKAAINNAYSRYDLLLKYIYDSKTRVLATNTDGIWVVGNNIHNEDEGPLLRQWSYDHNNCTIRFKSAGSYEFIEDNKYYPVVRGRTKLDNIVPREEWQWGYIFMGNAKQLVWSFKQGVGITWEEI